MTESSSYYSLLSASPFSWENFLEIFAQLTSYALTDRETEAIISGVHAFHARLKRLSNNHLRRLAEEANSSECNKPQCRHVGKTCTQNALRGYIKAFLVGYGVKFLSEAVPGLLTGRLIKRPSLIKQMGGRDTIQFGMFLAAFIGTYKAMLCTIRHLRKKYGYESGGDRLNAFIAGTIAGLALAIERNKERRLAIALYLTTRSAQFTCVWLANRWAAARARRRRGLMRVRSEIVMSKASAGASRRAGVNEPTGMKSGLGTPTAHTHASTSTASTTNTGAVRPSIQFTGLEKANAAAHSKLGRSLKKEQLLHEEREPVEFADRLDAWLRAWGGTLVMALASSQILFAYIVAPQTLPRSYYGFLVVHGGLKSRYGSLAVPMLSQIGEAVLRMNNLSGAETQVPDNMTSAEFIAREVSPNIATVLPQGVRHNYFICALEHPWNTSCTKAHLSTFVGAIGRSLKLYMPLNAIMTVIFSGRRLIKDPVNTLTRYVKSVIRSSVFLSSYVTVAWLVPCTLRRLLKREAIWFYYVNGILSGLCALIEAPGRRIELGMYCLPRALESFWRCGVQWGWWHNIRHAEVAYFAFAMGALMSIYQTAPESIHGSYRDVMTRCFGQN
jgi:hypothetical protein